MSQTHASEHLAEIYVENIGGINETAVSLSSGVTSLTGRNATNRTSLLRALMAALGSDHVSLKGDAEEGYVELTVGETTYTRTLERKHGTVMIGGEPYLDDPEGADLFAFLLENNEARQAVARGDDLREIIMRPVDTDAIQAEISQLEAEQRDLDDQLDRLDTLDNQLPELEQERTQLEDQIETKHSELEEKEAAIEAADSTVDATREEQAEFEETLTTLQDTRADLDEVRYELDSERESIHALEDERAEISAELDEMSETPAGDLSSITAEIDRLREHKQSLDSTISQLQRVLQFNEELLEGNNPELQQALQDTTDTDSEDGALTDQLLPDETTICWTCGSEVEREAIDETLDNLRSLRQENVTERNELSTELDELTTRRDEVQADRDRREQLERKRDNIDREIDDREHTIEELIDEREQLEAEISELEAEIDALENHEQSELLDLHKDANQLEFELGRLETDHEDVTNDIETIESELAERARLEDERAAIQEELTDLRTRIEHLEHQAVEAFNHHMQTILDVLAYENIERIWLERAEREVREGRRTVQQGVFDLHVVRSTEDGTAYEDTVTHLSESEREVTGLVFALAGYLVHDLHETLPFMVIDSVEALDSDRIAALVEYFQEYAPYLVIALLPEDAAALDDAYQRITEI